MATAVMETSAFETRVDDEALYEVIDERRVEKAPMGAYLVHVASTLASRLSLVVLPQNLGRLENEMLFLIDKESNLQYRPDLAFVSFERWPKRRGVPRKFPWDVIPDLTVEVVSPSNRASEILRKTRAYFEAGVRFVWILFPDERVIHSYRSFASINVLSVGDDLRCPELFPRFEAALGGHLRRFSATRTREE